MSNNPKSEKLTFLELIKKQFIEIPIIQRDYAQGREGKEELRKNFLYSLKEAIDGQPLELDFIYGSDKDNVLQPLDGQQRLTTLYLLHWYFAIKENKLNDELKNILSKFTYETRTSSREFCNDLINKGIEYNIEQNISEQIIDSSWFFLSWKKDPTIKSMLTMLDTIDHTFKYTTINFEKLNNISFHFIELKNFGLSDDLYIKMNARGKALTDFENFKAKFEQYIKKVIYKTYEKREEVLENGKKIVLKENWEKELSNPFESFAHKMDTLWTDLFWKYKGNDNIIDNEIINFISGIAIYNLAISKNFKDTETEKIISDLSENPNLVRPEMFDKDGYDYLKKCFDIYCINNYDSLQANIIFWDNNHNSLFSELLNNKSFTYSKRLLFYGQTEFLINNEFDQSKFNEWMRVLRNIVENSTNNRVASFVPCIKLIKELSTYSDDIYKNLLKKPEIKSNFGKKQYNQEIRKSELIELDIFKNKEVIFKMEDTNFCKGDLDFALYCLDEFEIEKLDKIRIIFENDFDITNKVSNEFKSAFLTISNNKYYEYWWQWSYSFNCNKGYLFDFYLDLVRFAKSNDWKQEYLKDLILKRVDYSYKEIINNYIFSLEIPKWKERLIKNSELINDATFILIPPDNSYCLLSWQQRPSNDHQVVKIEN